MLEHLPARNAIIRAWNALIHKAMLVSAAASFNIVHCHRNLYYFSVLCKTYCDFLILEMDSAYVLIDTTSQMDQHLV